MIYAFREGYSSAKDFTPLTTDSACQNLVSVVIPTLNRPLPLKRAVLSVLKQTLPDDISLQILIIDNSKDRSAEWIKTDPDLATFKGSYRYLSEPNPGVANARNAGLEHAEGMWVAFLDDDEEASEHWLAGHIATLKATKADASFGPVMAKAEEGDVAPRLINYFSRSIPRPDGHDITNLRAYLGTNNSVFGRTSCLRGANTFDTSLNETGGEDSLLLRNLALSGKTFAWSATSSVTEWVPARRATWDYVKKRRFLSGQIRAFVNRKLTPPRWDLVLLWMVLGTCQAAGWFAVSLFLKAVDETRASEARTKCWGGLGKLFWGARFGPRLYGAGLVS